MRCPFLVGVLATPYARKGASLWQAPQAKFSDEHGQKVAFPSEFSDAWATAPVLFIATHGINPFLECK
jgi:hypothetical protein